MIGSADELYNAAQGKGKPREITAPTPVANGYNEALKRRSQFARTVSEASADQRAGGQGITTAATPTYTSILSNTTRASGGLNSTGKYGGFNNAGDLQTAIEGSAISLGRTTPMNLRAKADAYYNKLDPMYGKASIGAQQWTRNEMGYNPESGSAASFRQFEETSQNRTAPLRNYATQLGNWYNEQSKPAEEYLSTAQQLESTPLSALAQQIATKQYGMNPDLAAGKFLGLDDQYAKTLRDQQYMQEYGTTYDMYKQQQADQKAVDKDLRTQSSELAKANIENITGFSAKTLSTYTGKTNEQMADSLKSSVTYTDPEDNTEKTTNTVTLVNGVKNLIADGQADLAQKLIDSISDNEDSQYLLRALLYMGYTLPNKKEITNAPYAPVSG